jgi:hypothetical protein
MVTTTLSKIATIQVGNTFRSSLEPDPSGKVLVVQMKDVLDQEVVDPRDLCRIAFGVIKDSHEVRPGDILFRSRGTRVTCALAPQLHLPTVLAAPLFRIRVTDPRIDPSYLTWFINQPGRKHMESRAEGSDLKMISVQSLRDLEVIVPSMTRQKKIVELASLVREEARLMQAISNKRTELVTSCLARALQEK